MNLQSKLKENSRNFKFDESELASVFPPYSDHRKNSPYIAPNTSVQKSQGTQPFVPNKNSPISNLPQRNSQNQVGTKSSRTGMSETAWQFVFGATEIVLDIIKGVMIVGGIIASNLADFIMGSIGISLIVNTNISNLTFVNGFGFGSILSMGSSSIQIYMWSLIQKRGISAGMLLNPKMWKNIPKDVRSFLWTALFLWIIDTILDVSPTFVLFTSENFSHMPTLYSILVSSVVIIVAILCGFAEILTSNMRAMLAGQK